MSPVEGRSDTKRYQVYLDALALDQDPSTPAFTVCVNEAHYRDGRHPVPYRKGYCHAFRTPEEHYHTSWEELVACPLT